MYNDLCQGLANYGGGDVVARMQGARVKGRSRRGKAVAAASMVAVGIGLAGPATAWA